MVLHLARERLTGHHWIMDDGAQHLGGGIPRIMTDSFTDPTLNPSS